MPPKQASSIKNMIVRSLFIATTILLAISCTNEKKELPSINGVWKSIGSGWVLEIQDSTKYALYDITSISCIPNREGEAKELLESIRLKGDTLSLLKGVITYQFLRTDTLPSLCATALQEKDQKDVLYNFEVFAETVREHYAFMELNHINWDQLYEDQKNKLNPNSTEAELYLIIEETLEKLNDNHAYLEANEDVYEAIEQLSVEEEEEDAEADKENLPEYGDFQVAAMVAKHHLKESMTKDSWLIEWGKLKDGIGFIQLKSMWLYADLEIPQSLIDEIGYVDAYVQTFHEMYEGDYIEKEVQGVRKIMDVVMNDLKDMELIVIDTRFNGGGQDAVSFEILSRFISGNLQIATQQLRYGDHFTPILPLYIEGSDQAYTKPVYVLTSQQTGSAAEAFAIATMSVDHIKRIGAPSSGAMSTALEKTLPNSWYFSISNEIYMDNKRNSYENKGIPVDYDLKYPADRQTFFKSVADDLQKDKLDILRAIEEL